MKLTKSTDYALRVLIYLESNQQIVTMRELSSQLFIPYDNLTKIIQKLAKSGIIQTIKGKNGGVKRNSKSKQATLYDVIGIIDGPTRLSPCIADPTVCGLSCNCRLKHVLGELEGKINALFSQFTIKDVMPNECTETV